MLLIDRLMGVILLKIDAIFWYFAGQSLHSHTIFQLTQETISPKLTLPTHSIPSPQYPLIPTILHLSAILLPSIYSKLPTPYLTPYSPLFSTSLYTYTYTLPYTYSTQAKSTLLHKLLKRFKHPEINLHHAIQPHKYFTISLELPICPIFSFWAIIPNI